MFFLCLLYTFICNAVAGDRYGDADFWQGDKTIYIDPATITMDAVTGTSVQLNKTMYTIGAKTGTLEHRINYNLAHLVYDGKIRIWTPDNVGFKSDCEWQLNSLKCGVEEGIWVMKTDIVVSDKYATINMVLYDNKGDILSSSYKTVYGTIRHKPQWKLTKVKKESNFGNENVEVFEQWPHKIQEFPPLVLPRHIDSAIKSLYLSI